MTLPLPLIDKQDNFEIVDMAIPSILAVESASQVALATTAGKPDPDDWKLRVYSERSNPWEEFLNDVTDKSPIVNVWFDTTSFDTQASDTYSRQKSESVYNIDIYGYGVSSDNPAGGHNPGDLDSALTLHRGIKLVRNILMSAEYAYLGFPKGSLVWYRWINSITAFQPAIDGQAVENVRGARIALRVDFNELSPQIEAEVLEFVSVDVKRTEDGEIVLEADFDYTAP